MGSTQITYKKTGKLLTQTSNRKFDWSSTLKKFGVIVRQSVRKQFSSNGKRFGPGWPDLAPSTIRYKKSKGRSPKNILVDNSILKNSIVTPHATGSIEQIDANTLMIGTNIKYGHIHQYGGKINIEAHTKTLYYKMNKKTGTVGNRFVKKSRSNFAQDAKVKKHSINIPQRQFLGVCDQDIQDMKKTIITKLNKDYGGK